MNTGRITVILLRVCAMMALAGSGCAEEEPTDPGRI